MQERVRQIFGFSDSIPCHATGQVEWMRAIQDLQFSAVSHQQLHAMIVVLTSRSR